jgi:hypothetical protein
MCLRRDFISMPAFAGFKSADHFYNVAFHELAHWSGHKARLDRDLKNRFASRHYAAEELIAEFGAAFLCAEFGFDGDVRNAGYIGNWIELLKADKRAFFIACSHASKAADYLRGPLLKRRKGPRDGTAGAPIQTTHSAAAALGHPLSYRRHHRGVLRRPRLGDVRLARRWLVLVLSAAGLSGNGAGCWAIPHELRGLSSCNGSWH